MISLNDLGHDGEQEIRGIVIGAKHFGARPYSVSAGPRLVGYGWREGGDSGEVKPR